MQQVLLSFTLLLFSTAVFADLVVDRINSDRTRVHLTGEVSKPTTSSILIFTDAFDVTCRATPVRFEATHVIADISNCKNAAEITKGARFTVSNNNQGRATSVQQSANLPTANEDWYTLWGLGLSSISYGDKALNDAFDEADNTSGVSRSNSAVDLFGFYWPHDGHTEMSGFVISGVQDKLTAPGEEVSIALYTYSYSYHKFYGANIGDKWFWRGDVGLARAVVYVDVPGFSARDSSDWGLGGLLGGGYGWAIGSETRMLLGGYLAHRTIKSESATSFSALLSFLW